MKVNVKYFGMLAEKIGCASETLELNFDHDCNLREYFESKYPSIKEINYKIAVNQQINDFLANSKTEVEIALLPPFAGG